MLFIREFTVRKHERGLLFKNGDFVRFLAPAVYRFFDPRRRIDVERYDLSQPAFEHRLVDYLVRWHPEAVEDMFLRVETGADQVAVITRNGHPWNVVGPERRALFWKGVIHVKAEIFEITEDGAIAPRFARTLAANRDARRGSVLEHAALLREVPEAHMGLLHVDGRLVRELPPGLHAFWTFGRSVTIELCDQRLKTLDVCGRDVLTNDNLSLDVTLSADYRIADASLAARTLREPQGFLHKHIQAALRTAVETRSLDALFASKAAVAEDVLGRVRDRLAPLGIELRDVHVKDVQLLDDGPATLRLKELEALERITDKVGTVSVYGDLTGVLNELVRIKL
jgi:hypothetical protein